MRKIIVHAKPSSHKEFVEKIDDIHFTVSVKEPPVKGRANEAIVRAFAEYFKIPKVNVRIVSGSTSRNKTVEIDGL